MLLGGNTFLNLVQKDRITIQGEVEFSGHVRVKVGVWRFFQGSDATASYRLADTDAVDFRNEFGPNFVPVSPASSDATVGTFKLIVQSQEQMAQFLVLAFEDFNNNSRWDWDELRAQETYQITKSGGTFFGLRASGSVLAPLATGSFRQEFAEADRIRYKFTLPPIELPPAPPQASPSS